MAKWSNDALNIYNSNQILKYYKITFKPPTNKNE